MDVGGSRTRYIEAGDPASPKLLLLHGMALLSEVWAANIDALAAQNHVVAVDMLGHGFTRPAEGLVPTIPAKLEHLARFTCKLGFDSFAVAGSSYGALIGALLYLEQRLPVTKLVITSSGSTFNTEAEFVAQTRNPKSIFHAPTVDQTVDTWKQRLSFNFANVQLFPHELALIAAHAYAQSWAQACWRTTVETMMDIERFRPFRILEHIDRIDIPTLVAWGRQDPGGVLASAEAAVKRMPNARIEVYDPCGHYPMIEHPQQYNESVLAFLRSR
jgi:2-hydroxy-6-oxonona-2,4-dienedioate hydrolase